MKINDIPDDALVINNGYTRPAGDLKSDWPHLPEDEKKDWYTTISKHLSIDAKKIIDYIFDKLEEIGYEDMADRLWEQTSAADIERFQRAINYLLNNSAADIYTPYQQIEDRE